MLPIPVTQFRPIAAKAVNGYVYKQFNRYFSREEIEDMVSEVVLRMWKARDSYQEEKGGLPAWVGTIARNVVKSTAKFKCKRSDISESMDDEVVSFIRAQKEFDTDAHLLKDEARDRLFARLKSERDKRFLTWRLEGYDADEIAEKEGISVQKVYMALFHMRERLRPAA